MRYVVAKKRSVFILCVHILTVASSCKKEGAISGDEMIHPVTLEVPLNFPKYTDDLDNTLSTEGIELGRLLFYDTRLSGNNTLSCASCHRQDIAFSDGISLSSIGASGAKLQRHSPALINLAWETNGLFWDGGSTNLESQAFAPITSADEMFQNLSELEAELKTVPDYVKRFRLVFGREIRSTDVVKALAQFERTLISGNSKYDRYVRKEQNAALSDEELLGMAIVNTKCRSCHAGELFTDNSYHNNGIDSDFSNADHEGIFQGRSRITFDCSDLGKFRTPTLRNVMLTAPYMHDGRFANIDQVIEHYNSGVKQSPTLDDTLRRKAKLGIAISADEKKAIIAFLNTLTDNTFTTNKKLSKP